YRSAIATFVAGTRRRGDAGQSNVPRCVEGWLHGDGKTSQPRYICRSALRFERTVDHDSTIRSPRVHAAKVSNAVISRHVDGAGNVRPSGLFVFSERSGEMMKLRLVPFLLLVAGVLYGQDVPFERILNANKEPQNWLTYGGTLFNQRYSLLNQITIDNVKNLELQWVLQVRALDGISKFEATPLVVDGVMYVVKPPMPNYEVVALDAATGRVFWTYTYTPG